MKHLNKRLTAIVSILIFSVGLMLPSSIVAASGKKATQAALDAAITDIQDQLTELGSPRTYEIGGRGPAGGLVFYTDEFGLHGLEAAPADQGDHIDWHNNGIDTDTEAHGDGVGAGEMNTMLIIANQGHDSYNYAAGLCANLVITNKGVDYGDWYLPSKEELNLMLYNLWCHSTDSIIDSGFHLAEYWSSTEEDDSRAWSQFFNCVGNQFTRGKGNPKNVRAIRAF